VGTVRSFEAITVDGLPRPVRALTAGRAHTCALLDDGRAACWGRNNAGQLGVGTGTQEDVRVTFTRDLPEGAALPAPQARIVTGRGVGAVFTQIDAGHEHTCGILVTGGAACWGNNVDGRLGDGSTTTRFEAVPVARLAAGLTWISAGEYDTCAVQQDGSLWCWGAGLQAGEDGRREPSPLPVRIEAFGG